MKDWAERLRTIAESVFPNGTRLIAPHDRGDWVVLVSWRLGPEPPIVIWLVDTHALNG